MSVLTILQSSVEFYNFDYFKTSTKVDFFDLCLIKFEKF